jgi:hypothetical protein
MTIVRSSQTAEQPTVPTMPARADGPFRTRAHRWSIRILYTISLFITAALSSELTARFHDYLSHSIPFWHSPDHDKDLTTTGLHGERHGRPFGVYGRWKMNNVGLHGADIDPSAGGSRVRILVLGSSEAFGLYESPGNEFPGVLHRLLSQQEHHEVLNAALPGMTVGAAAHNYKHWSSKFRANIVVLYSNPLFYLNVSRGPIQPSTSQPIAKVDETAPFRFRMEGRLRDTLSLPQWLVDIRDARTLARARAEHRPDWIFQSAPAEQLTYFESDVRSFVTLVKEFGATPVLVTHATKVKARSSPQLMKEVERAVVHTPRATPAALLDFEEKANEVIRRISDEHNIPMIDVDKQISGRVDYFADFVHFSDEGASRVAHEMATSLIQVTDSKSIHQGAP